MDSAWERHVSVSLDTREAQAFILILQQDIWEEEKGAGNVPDTRSHGA
jgi:hypothetical protein